MRPKWSRRKNNRPGLVTRGSDAKPSCPSRIKSGRYWPSLGLSAGAPITDYVSDRPDRLLSAKRRRFRHRAAKVSYADKAAI